MIDFEVTDCSSIGFKDIVTNDIEYIDTVRLLATEFTFHFFLKKIDQFTVPPWFPVKHLWASARHTELFESQIKSPIARDVQCNYTTCLPDELSRPQSHQNVCFETVFDTGLGHTLQDSVPLKCLE